MSPVAFSTRTTTRLSVSPLCRVLRLAHIFSIGIGVVVHRMNEELGGIMTFKLRGEDTLRDSGVPYTIVRPVALTEEPGGAPLSWDQGDDLKGKISRDDVADICLVRVRPNVGRRARSAVAWGPLMFVCLRPARLTFGLAVCGVWQAALDEAAALDVTFEVKSTVPFSTPWTVRTPHALCSATWVATVRYVRIHTCTAQPELGHLGTYV